MLRLVFPSNCVAVVNEIKQKDVMIDTLKKRLRQGRSISIPVGEVDSDRMSQQSSYYGSQRRIIHPNRQLVHHETEIINGWNKIVQIYQDSPDPTFISHLKVMRAHIA